MSWIFVNFQCQATRRNAKRPYWKLSGDGSVHMHGTPETDLQLRQASMFTPPLHVTLKCGQNNERPFSNIRDIDAKKKADFAALKAAL